MWGKTGIRNVSRPAAVAAALCSALFGATLALPIAPAASAATTYWSFDNAKRGCLESTASGTVFEGACDSGNVQQDWYWTGSMNSQGRRMLASRVSGRCLATDIKSGLNQANAVWTSFTCDADAKGQRWRFDYNGIDTYGQFDSGYGTALRTSPGLPESVYSDEFTTTVALDYYYWSTSLSG
nr:RICIN domain-containing protein [Streptomyces sp. NBC_00899]